MLLDLPNVCTVIWRIKLLKLESLYFFRSPVPLVFFLCTDGVSCYRTVSIEHIEVMCWTSFSVGFSYM